MATLERAHTAGASSQASKGRAGACKRALQCVQEPAPVAHLSMANAALLRE